jgi:hypothetical protein
MARREVKATARRSVSKPKVEGSAKAETSVLELISFSDDASEQFVKVLLCGPSKSGKTYLAGSFPDPVFLNFDKGMKTLSKLHVPFITFYRSDEGLKDGMLHTWLDVHEVIRNFKNKEGKYWNALVEKKYVPKTLVLDSLSSMSDVLEVDLLENPPTDSKGGRKAGLELQDYNVMKQRILGIIDSLREVNMHLVVTSGVEMDKDDQGKMLEIPISTGRKVGMTVPHYFDDVYRMHYDKDKEKWIADPQQSRYFIYAGSRHDIPMEPIENPTFNKIKKYYGVK